MRRSQARKPDRTGNGGLVRLIVTVAVLAWLVRSLVFAPFSIPSGSMLPTLLIGDYLVAAKWPYGYSRYSFPFRFPPIPGRILPRLPERGDIVVFATPDGSNADFVKRVIGLPGDTVELRSGKLLLNGTPVATGAIRPMAVPVSANSPCRRITPRGIGLAVTNDRQCVYTGYRETLPNGVSYQVIDQADNPIADNFGPVRVPPGRLFLMGDNRDDSLDSRFSVAEGGIGMVPIENVIGRASLVFWSTDGSASYVQPWTWFSALRSDRVGKGLRADSR